MFRGSKNSWSVNQKINEYEINGYRLDYRESGVVLTTNENKPIKSLKLTYVYAGMNDGFLTLTPGAGFNEMIKDTLDNMQLTKESTGTYTDTEEDLASMFEQCGKLYAAGLGPNKKLLIDSFEKNFINQQIEILQKKEDPSDFRKKEISVKKEIKSLIKSAIKALTKAQKHSKKSN